MKLTDLLLQARAAGVVADVDAAIVPDDPADAYRAALDALGGEAVAAWKLGGANPWSNKVFGNTELFFGPLVAAEVIIGGDSFPLAGLVSPLGEPEIMLELGDWPLGSGPLFTRMALGIEIPASVLPPAAKARLTGQIIDRAGAGGLWMGPPQPFDGAALAENFEVSFRHNDEAPQTGQADNVFAGPVGSALLFLGQARRRGIALKAGQWIATGGLVPAVPVKVGDRLSAEAAGMKVELRFV